ncbi:hypothetical protein CHU98_g4475 [Xylaria longipes]|nr:hypothetical protein CHU98_g4475 [Xylaria longipes]
MHSDRVRRTNAVSKAELASPCTLYSWFALGGGNASARIQSSAPHIFLISDMLLNTPTQPSRQGRFAKFKYLTLGRNLKRLLEPQSITSQEPRSQGLIRSPEAGSPVGVTLLGDTAHLIDDAVREREAT